jgi:predicted RNase H-like nuclease
MKASCHASNLGLYPDAASSRLADMLSAAGYEHLGAPSRGKWQIECYPHPAIIELFGLPERLLYKKGSVGEKRAGQVQLARYLQALGSSQVLPLRLGSSLAAVVDEATILARRGKALKRNEDALDAIICTYIGALYARGAPCHCFGSAADGYIYVPAQPCLPAENR